MMFLIAGISVLTACGGQQLSEAQDIVAAGDSELVASTRAETPLAVELSSTQPEIVDDALTPAALTASAADVLQTFSDLSAVRFGYAAEEGTYESTLIDDGAYFVTLDITLDGSKCQYAYDPLTLEALSACFDSSGDTLLALTWTGVPSAGTASKKHQRVIAAGSLPPHVGVVGRGSVPSTVTDEFRYSATREEEPEAELSSSAVVGEVENSTGVVLSAADISTGRVLYSLDVVSAVDHEAARAEVESMTQDLRRVISSSVGRSSEFTEAFGFTRLEVAEIGQVSSHLESVPTSVGGVFSLSDLYFADTTSEPGDGNPPSTEVIVAVYRSGLREVTITYRDAAPSSTVGAVRWQASPLDYAGFEDPDARDGDRSLRTSEPVAFLPDNAWGIVGSSLVTIEGLFTEPGTIEDVVNDLVG